MNEQSVFGSTVKKIEHTAQKHRDENYKHLGNEVGYTNVKSKCTNGRIRTALKKNIISDRSKVDTKIIEQIVTTLEELKMKVNYFENYIMYEVEPKAGDASSRRKPVETIGDTNESKNLFFRDRMGNSKLEQIGINPVKGKSETDTSVIKSSLSLTKNTYISINPALTSKNFKLTAQDLIKQAEELKSNITGIVDSENYDTATISDESEITVNPYSKDKNVPNNQSPLHCLLLSVGSQYESILKTLGSIEQQIQSEKHQVNKKQKLSQASVKVSTYIPNGLDKVEILNSRKTDTKTNSVKTEAPKASKKKCRRKLDPIVLVYEPIKPSHCAQNLCLCCGSESSSCLLENCHNRVVQNRFLQTCKTEICSCISKLWWCIVNPNIEDCSAEKIVIFAPKMKSSFEKQDAVSCGFMVSYTPNIQNGSERVNDQFGKNCRKLKKKKTSCLWF